MDDVSERNSNYRPLTARDDTLMQRVVDYYNRKGTPNQRMEAYYLLGSVYRDLHDAPKAMEAFMNGINAADTVEKDCRFDLLVRLYGQKNEILCKQKLYNQAAKENEFIYHYGIRANDSLYVIDTEWKRLGMHFKSQDYEKIAQECWGLLKKSEEWGFLQYASTQLNTSILAHIELGQIDKARRLMTIYEQESGKVDLRTMECSFPIYYYAKGRLLLAEHKTDSAEIFFRREMKERDWNNRQAAYRGLREVFEQRHQTDSALKYARLQCEAVDSDYQTKVTENMQNLQQLYDYSRTQEDNHQKALQLQQEQRRGLYMCCTFAFLLLLMAFLSYHLHLRYKQKVTEAELELERAQMLFAEKENELERLRNVMSHVGDGPDKTELERLVEKAEREVEAQREEVMRRGEFLDHLRRKALHHAKTLRQQYYDTPAVQNLRVRMETKETAQDRDYEEIRHTLEAQDRGLSQRLDAMTPHLSDLELRVILLLKVGLRKAEVARLTAHAESSISSLLNRLYEKVNQRRPINSGESLEWVMGL